MPEIEISGRLVQPLAGQVQDWEQAGKLDDDDLPTALSTDARAWVDHSISPQDWARLADVEELVSLAADMLGGEAGLVEWAEAIVPDLLLDAEVQRFVAAGRRLVDGPGFTASQASRLLVRRADWTYEGGERVFQLRIAGLESASPGLKALIGALLARLAASADARDFDVRVDGVDSGDLVVFGELEGAATLAEDAQSRLHRAALIP